MMSLARWCLLLVGLAALLGVAQAAATLFVATYTNPTLTPDCTGTPSSVEPIGFDMGVCPSGVSFYCDDRNVYVLQHSDPGCSLSALSSITAVPLDACTLNRGSPGAYEFQTYQCVNATQGPQLPLAYPPPGWIVMNQYENRTTQMAASTCNGGADSVNVQLATPARCENPGSGGSASSQTFLTNTGYRAIVSYSDQDCKNFTDALVQPILCSDGLSVAVSFGFPADLPTQGIARYRDADANCTDVPFQVMLYSPTACADSRMYVCDANKTQIEVDVYGSSTCTGSPYQADTYAAGSSAAPAVCTNSVRYFCAYDTTRFIQTIIPSSSTGSGGLGSSSSSSTGADSSSSSTGGLSSSSTGNLSSASTASVSLVFLAAAAIVALIFGREL
jgi:hypothetical protein